MFLRSAILRLACSLLRVPAAFERIENHNVYSDHRIAILWLSYVESFFFLIYLLGIRIIRKYFKNNNRTYISECA